MKEFTTVTFKDLQDAGLFDEIPVENKETDQNIDENMNEHHLHDRKSQVGFILSKSNSYKSEDLALMSDGEINSVYLSVEKEKGISEWEMGVDPVMDEEVGSNMEETTSTGASSGAYSSKFFLRPKNAKKQKPLYPGGQIIKEEDGEIIIKGKKGDAEPEQFDTATSGEEAAYLVREYSLYFGTGWEIWAEKDGARLNDVNIDVNSDVNADVNVDSDINTDIEENMGEEKPACECMNTVEDTTIMAGQNINPMIDEEDKTYQNGTVTMVKLIDDNGKMIDKEGWAEEGIGVFDDKGNEYAGGFDKNGLCFGSMIDTDDTVLSLTTNERLPFKVGEHYNIIKTMEENMNLNEAVQKVKALAFLDKIKEKNKSIEKEELNKAVQDVMKKTDGYQFVQDVPKAELPKEEIDAKGFDLKKREMPEPNDLTVEDAIMLDRGKTPLDHNYGIEPTDKFKEVNIKGNIVPEVKDKKFDTQYGKVDGNGYANIDKEMKVNKDVLKNAETKKKFDDEAPIQFNRFSTKFIKGTKEINENEIGEVEMIEPSLGDMINTINSKSSAYGAQALEDMGYANVKVIYDDLCSKTFNEPQGFISEEIKKKYNVDKVVLTEQAQKDLDKMKQLFGYNPSKYIKTKGNDTKFTNKFKGKK